LVESFDGIPGDRMSTVPLKQRVEMVDIEWACQIEVHYGSRRIARLREDAGRRRERQEEEKAGCETIKSK
jgi:hypothetical protein